MKAGHEGQENRRSEACLLSWTVLILSKLKGYTAMSVESWEGKAGCIHILNYS